MIAATMFSGIGAPELAMPGWDWRWCAEVDPFASVVLEQRFGHPNLGDVSAPDFVERAISHGRPDIVVFGSPCQSFSIAGKRLGLDDPRGNLALVALGVVRRLRPRWFVFENVPGLLSSAGGRDFGAFLGAVEQCGYGWTYRVLDAQHFGVAQRRRRVFVVGRLGDWRPAAAVLFEPASLRGYPPPRREAGEATPVEVVKGAAIGRKPEAGPQRGDVINDGSCFTLTTNEIHAGASPVASCPRGGSGYRNDADRADDLIVANGLRSASGPHGHSWGMRGDGSDNLVTHALRADGFDASEDGTGRGTLLVAAYQCQGTNVGEMGTLRCGNGHITGGGPFVVFTHSGYSNKPAWITGDRTDCLSSVGHHPSSHQGIGIMNGMAVRRLTPRECERLQGLPDDHTLIEWRGKPAPDGPRYRAIGNAMAVPVVRWILRRIAHRRGGGGGLGCTKARRVMTAGLR